MQLQPTWMDGLSPELVKKAKDELGETPEVREEALLELRKMIDDDPDFICPEDDSFLIRFLRVKKYNVKKAFKALRNYYEFKQKHPGVMTDKIKNVLDCDTMFVPKMRAPDGACLVIFYLGSQDLQKFSLEEFFKADALCCDQFAEIEANQVCGVHAILDFKGITFKKMLTMAVPSFISQVVFCLEDCWPHRIKSMTIINEPFYINVLYNIVLPMLSKKIKERMNFLGSNLSALHKKFPKEILPKRLGGKIGDEACKEFRETIIANQLEIERQNKYSFHRLQKPVKKHSTCGLEENSKFTENQSAAISNAAN